MVVSRASSTFLARLLLAASLGAGAGAGGASARDLAFGSETWRGHPGDFGEKGQPGCRVFSHFGNGDRVSFFAVARPHNPAVIDFWLGVGPASPNTGGPPGPDSISPVLARLARTGRTDAVRAWVDDAPADGVRGVATDRLVLAAVGPLTTPKAARFFHALREGKTLKIGVGGETRHYALRGTFVALSELVGCALRAHDAPVGPSEGLPVSRASPPPAPGPDTAASAPGPDTAAPAAASAARTPPPTRSPAAPRAGGTGSGVVVTREGHILTNQHVAEGCDGLAVRRAGEVELPARLVAQDVQNDLALLKVAGSFDAAVGVRIEQPRLGEAVVAYGFPLSGVLASSGNATFGNVSALTGLRDDSRAIQITAPLQPGSSGGPVLDGAGLLVGVVQGGLDAVRAAAATGNIAQNVNFALRGSLAANFLGAHRVEPALERRRPDLGAADVTELAQAVTVQVICRAERP